MIGERGDKEVEVWWCFVDVYNEQRPCESWNPVLLGFGEGRWVVVNSSNINQDSPSLPTSPAHPPFSTPQLSNNLTLSLSRHPIKASLPVNPLWFKCSAMRGSEARSKVYIYLSRGTNCKKFVDDEIFVTHSHRWWRKGGGWMIVWMC